MLARRALLLMSMLLQVSLLLISSPLPVLLSSLPLFLCPLSIIFLSQRNPRMSVANSYMLFFQSLTNWEAFLPRGHWAIVRLHDLGPVTECLCSRLFVFRLDHYTVHLRRSGWDLVWAPFVPGAEMHTSTILTEISWCEYPRAMFLVIQGPRNTVKKYRALNSSLEVVCSVWCGGCSCHLSLFVTFYVSLIFPWCLLLWPTSLQDRSCFWSSVMFNKEYFP